MSSSNRNSTINGIPVANARKIAKRTFGEHLEKVIHNADTRTFDVYIYDTVDRREIEKFEEWKEFRIFLGHFELHVPKKKAHKTTV